MRRWTLLTIAPVFLLAVMAVWPFATRADGSEYAAQLINVDYTQTSWLRVEGSLSLEPQQFTIEYWMTPQGPGFGFPGTGGEPPDSVGSCLVVTSHEGDAGEWICPWGTAYSAASGLVTLHIVHQYQVSGTALYSQTPIPIGDTVHLAFTFDGHTVKIYINGVLDASKNTIFSSIWYAPPAEMPVLFGAANSAFYYWRRFDGTLDDIRIWDYARSQSEI